MYGHEANRTAEQAAARWDDKQTEAIGEGLAAIAYALLDVAHAIRPRCPTSGPRCKVAVGPPPAPGAVSPRAARPSS